ncbi:MAG: RtcB family protein [Candidatus Micrarchaeota archaeon]
MKIKQINEAIWEIEKESTMKVPALIFGTKPIMEKMKTDRTLLQLYNVASLNGIIKYAMVMPDGHEGYGFPIGGVAAFDAEEGIVSPGGVGYDLNCGVRLVRTGLKAEQVKPKIKQLADKLFTNVPSGVGSEGKLKLSHAELDEVARLGTEWTIEKGYGWKEDAERTEEYGRMNGADESKVSPTAKARGKSQLGTLGAGNHFLEIQRVEKIIDENIAKSFGLEKDEIVVMIHCGSRGYGHQICTDQLGSMLALAKRTNLWLPDRELVYAPIKSREAHDYMAAMKCAVNFAFANRQIIMHWVRQVFDDVLGKGTSDNMNLVYDVAHNIAKIEEHEVDGQRRKLIVHRKGATRAFPAGRTELPPIYRNIGQPVIIPGSMGTASYVLVGNKKGLDMSWGSTCHGSGRVMSRGEAIRSHDPNKIIKDLTEKQQIYIRATDKKVISEEAPDAYKNVDEVVQSVAHAGISDIVAKVIPLAVVKG